MAARIGVLPCCDRRSMSAMMASEIVSWMVSEAISEVSDVTSGMLTSRSSIRSVLPTATVCGRPRKVTRAVTPTAGQSPKIGGLREFRNVRDVGFFRSCGNDRSSERVFGIAFGGGDNRQQIIGTPMPTRPTAAHR